MANAAVRDARPLTSSTSQEVARIHDGNGQVPAVSVLMPVYNTEAYLAPAIDSILNQTFGDFEFIILDDGSTDRSPEIVREFAARDSRIRFVPAAHQGYVALLRQGLALCRGEFIARMDSDDISMPQRFERQIEFLRAHLDVVVVGSRIVLIDPYGSRFEKPQHYLEHDQIEAELLAGVGWAIVHPAAMMRRDAVNKLGGYRQDLCVSEDLDLFLRLAEIGKLANLPEVLLQYRQHLTSVNFTRYKEQKAVKRQIVAEAYRRRGMTMPAEWRFQERRLLPHPEQHRRWGWAALQNGNIHVARKHAWAAMRGAPLQIESWRLTACALRGR